MISRPPDAEVAIIGLGVIGGSVALRLRDRGTAVRGFSTSVSDRAEAEHAGVAVSPTVDGAVRDVGLVLIAVPLDRISAVAGHVMGAAPQSATMLHAGSLQRSEALQALPEIAARLIGTHPLAGSHTTGFAGARADLFRDATVFVEQRADARQREAAEFFWSMAGARRIEYATAAAHDDAMSRISHLPQLASTALGATLADILEQAPDEHRVNPGPGARDATRLAMSSLEMWQPLLERAPTATVDALRALEGNVHRLRIALEERDWPLLRELWTRGQQWRATLEHGELT
ncbi:MAG TPA: prephenate dehydrogenase [Gemmatimonadaceae bacterium]